MLRWLRKWDKVKHTPSCYVLGSVAMYDTHKTRWMLHTGRKSSEGEGRQTGTLLLLWRVVTH